MSNEIAIASGSDVVQFDTKKGVAELCVEAALFKGGKAAAAVRDRGVESAVAKAMNGRFRAAAEILMVAFPSQHKAYDKLYSGIAWENKVSM